MRQTIIKYMRERQSPTILVLHLIILLLVISQIISSEFVEIEDNGEISSNTLEYIGSWIHFITGMVLFPIALAFTFIELKTHGIKYFFPYLWKDYDQIKADFDQLKKFQLPESSPKGIAPVVQGLGMGALLLVLLSGLSWFLLWNSGVGFAESVMEVHELLTGLIETYIFAHGAMGLLHIYLSRNKT